MLFSFYKIARTNTDKLVSTYEKEIGKESRLLCIEEFLKEWGAIGYTKSRALGRPSFVNAVIFPVSHEFVTNPGFDVLDRKEDMITLEGKKGTPSGDQFNKKLSLLNTELDALPEFTQWLYDHLGVNCSEPDLTHAQTEFIGRIRFLTTYGGRCGDKIVLAVPNHNGVKPNCKIHKYMQPVTPLEFESMCSTERGKS